MSIIYVYDDDIDCDDEDSVNEEDWQRGWDMTEEEFQQMRKNNRGLF